MDTNVDVQSAVAGDSAGGFRTVFCRHFGVNEAAFERTMVVRGVGVWYRFLARILMTWWPDLFRIEQEYLFPLRYVRTRREFASEVGAIADYNRYELPTWRALLGLRVSTRRLNQLGKLLPRHSAAS